jgi:glutamate racemase
MNYPLQIIDSAQATALAVARTIHTEPTTQISSASFYATDSIEKFQRLGSRFLGHPLPPVELIDLGG